MKKVVLAAMLSVFLSACGTKTIIVEKPADTTEAPVTTRATQPPMQTGEDVYIETVTTGYPSVMKNMGKKWVIDFGYLVCDEIDNGLTFDQLLQITVKSGADAEQIGYLVGAAIRSLCPENQWFIDSLNA